MTTPTTGAAELPEALTTAEIIAGLRAVQSGIGPRQPHADDHPDRARWDAIDAACEALRAQPARTTTPAAPAPGVPSGIYVASRASVPERPARWRALRDAGWPIVSTWIDEAGPGETDDLGELWGRITREVASAQGVLLHVEPDDFPLKGALIEVGMALSLGKRVGVYAPGVELEELSMRPLGSWAAHPLVYVAPTLQSARWWVEEAPQPPAAVMADCSGGSPCSTCPDKKKCSRGCVRQGGQA